MSSEFLEDIDDDDHGTAVMLSMKAGGDAFLTVSSESDKNFYHLPPNEKGWKNAEKIVRSMNAWLYHTKGMQYGRDAPRYTGIVVEKENYCALKVGDTEYELRSWDRQPNRKEMWLSNVGKLLEVVGHFKDGALCAFEIYPINPIKCKYCDNEAVKTLVWLKDKQQQPARIAVPWCGCDLMTALKRFWVIPYQVVEGIDYEIEDM